MLILDIVLEQLLSKYVLLKTDDRKSVKGIHL